MTGNVNLNSKLIKNCQLSNLILCNIMKQIHFGVELRDYSDFNAKQNGEKWNLCF